MNKENTVSGWYDRQLSTKLKTSKMTNSASGRGVRRKATTERGGKKFKNALEELRALKASGGKRVDNFEIVEEDAVYDEVSEDDYARLVQKRREEGM